MYQERQLESNEAEIRINDEYLIGQPKGALTILDKYSKFIGFIISKPEKKDRSEIAYALYCEYWNRGIGQSVLSKMVDEWGPEVCRIGLGENLYIQNKQEIFQFNGKELEQFRATVRPINVSSWSILKKVGFEPVLADKLIDFENKSTQILTEKIKLDNKLDPYISIKDQIAHRFKNIKVYAVSAKYDDSKKIVIKRPYCPNGFVATILHAYNYHKHLRLSSDNVWLTISQGVSHHINYN
ncbi:17189_t:CDS:2 [Dentiscutata erythropus]|uniref:17189_t:CDS:1 n=1 Tax=Dentiscutata erythropus TaxID=1348616 RepID=A0A9N9EUX6_9GLOM|nr:17189_t:CDS:2 [Dentiscutata erythropus]